MSKEKEKAVKEQQIIFGNQQKKEYEQRKRQQRLSLTAYNEVPLLVGDRRCLITREIFMADNCPKNDVSRMLKGEKEFELEDGFLPIGNHDEAVFEILLDFLKCSREFELPFRSFELEKVMRIAKV